MTGLGIEYSPCIKCDKTKCSFCELTRYKNSQEDNTEHITFEKFKNKADFVEVVRCKDCIHFEAITLDSGISVGFGNCKNKKGINLYPKETDYCSYGERSDT